MSQETQSVSIIQPYREPPVNSDMLADRRGYDVALYTSPEVVNMLANGVEQLVFSTVNNLYEERGHVVTAHPDDPKAVILSSEAGAPTTSTLIGGTPSYLAKHGSHPEVLILDEAAQSRFDLIADELTALCIQNVRENPPRKVGNVTYISGNHVPLGDMKNKFSAAWGFGGRVTGSEAQLAFTYQKRRKYIDLLTDAVKERSAQKGIPVYCILDRKSVV